MTLLFGGDTSFADSYVETRRDLAGRKRESTLVGLRPLLRSADAVIVNLETPLTSLEHSPLSGKKDYVHRDDPLEAPRVLRGHGIRAVSLGNNHAMDYDVEGLRQTIEALEAQGIDDFGAGASADVAGAPFVARVCAGARSVPLILLGGLEREATYDRRYRFYASGDRGGVNLLDSAAWAQQIQDLRGRHADALIVAFPHWGANYAWKSAAQTTAARRLIDAGADIVLGHGAHQLQEIERYGGGWIVYGLGNFLFNTPGRFAKVNAPPYGLAAQVVIEANGSGFDLKLYPLLSDNLDTDYRPRPVDEASFRKVWDLLRARGDSVLASQVTVGKDRAGRFLRLALPSSPNTAGAPRRAGN